MKVIGTLKVTVNADTSEFERALERVAEKVKELNAMIADLPPIRVITNQCDDAG